MEFKKGAQVTVSDTYYDLFDGGYIKPEKLLKNKEDVEKVKAAVKLVKEFLDSAIDQGVIEEA